MSVLLVSGIWGHLECPSLCVPVGWPLASCAQVGGTGLLPGPTPPSVFSEQVVGNVLAPEAQRRHRLHCQSAPGAHAGSSHAGLRSPVCPTCPSAQVPWRGPFLCPVPVSRSPTLRFKPSLAVTWTSLKEKRRGGGVGGWDATCPQGQRPEPPMGTTPEVTGPASPDAAHQLQSVPPNTANTLASVRCLYQADASTSISDCCVHPDTPCPASSGGHLP